MKSKGMRDTELVKGESRAIIGREGRKLLEKKLQIKDNRLVLN